MSISNSLVLILLYLVINITSSNTPVVLRVQRGLWTYSDFLLLGEQVVVLVALEQSDQNVLQPVPHAERELAQLSVHTGLQD